MGNIFQSSFSGEHRPLSSSGLTCANTAQQAVIAAVSVPRSHPCPCPCLQEPPNTSPKPGGTWGSRAGRGSNGAPSDPVSLICWHGGTHPGLALREDPAGWPKASLSLCSPWMQDNAPGNPLGLFSTGDGSIAWAKDSPQQSHPPAGSQSRNNGRKELRWEEPENRRREGTGEPGLKIKQTQNQVTQKEKLK